MDSYKIMTWNIRRLKSRKSKSNLKNLISKWDPSIICILETMMNMVDGMDIGFCFSNFIVYGHHSSSEKKVLWNKLRALSSVTIKSPSLFIGDFNCTRSSKEKLACFGRNVDSPHFNFWIRQSNLLDIQLCNSKFT